MTNQEMGPDDFYYILDENGNPEVTNDRKKFSKFYNKTSNRIVAKTVVGVYEVSTVFLAFLHGMRNGKPVLWETMIFLVGDRSGQQYFKGYQARYTSHQEALKGHAKAVQHVIKKSNSEPPPKTESISFCSKEELEAFVRELEFHIKNTDDLDEKK